MPFRPIRLSLPLRQPNPYGKARVEVDAIEWVGTGLAIHGAYQEDRYTDGYCISHVPSGLLVFDHGFETLVQAGAAIKCLLPLTDWTQGVNELRRQKGLLSEVLEVGSYAPVFFPPSCRHERSV